MKNFLKSVLVLIFTISSLAGFAGRKKTMNALATRKISDIQMLSSFLVTAGGNLADGNRVVFDSQYSNMVDGNDAIKFLNPSENFGLLRDNKVLAVEARQPIAAGDTIFYNMTNLVPQIYKLEIAPENISAAGITCELIDRYLHTRSIINLNDSNHFNIEITSDPASKAINRFIVVFSAAPGVAAFRFSSIAANSNNTSVIINWQVNQELNLAYYEVEHSADNIHFNVLHRSFPLYNDENGGTYQYNDMMPLNTDNFYRIRCVNKSGPSTYSDIVKISVPAPTTGMNVYPNPVINHSFQINLHKLVPGKYYIKLTTSSGQQVYAGTVTISSYNFTPTIKLDTRLGKADYNLSIFSANGIINTQRLVIQ